MIARVTALLCLALAMPALADPQDCDGGAFTIEAPTAALSVTICDALLEARDALLACGLEQSRPITVEVMSGISHPIGECLSYYECDFDTIRVTAPDALADALSTGDAYSVLPPEVLLTSLLTHELAHALVAQSAGDRRINIVDQEYIAAALELENMDPGWRDALIRAAPVSLPFTGSRLTLCGSSAEDWFALGYELEAIAAAVIGGTALSGGIGTIYGAILGALLAMLLERRPALGRVRVEV